MLFPLLELFDILGEVDGFPFLCFAGGSIGGLVGRPAGHQAASLVLRPVCFDFFQLFLPSIWIAIDRAAHMGRIAAVALEHLHKPRVPQLQQVAQWCELVITLHESLDVHVQSPTLLALNGTINWIDAAKDAALGRGIAPECVHARPLWLSAIWALWTISYSKEVPESQQHQHTEAFRTS